MPEQKPQEQKDDKATQTLSAICDSLVDSILAGVKCLTQDILVPTEATIDKMLIISASITGCEVLLTLFRASTFISWQGALLCTLVLGGMSIYYKHQDSILMQAYKKGKQKSDELLKRTANALTCHRADRRGQIAGNNGKCQGSGKSTRRITSNDARLNKPSRRDVRSGLGKGNKH